MAHHDPAEHVLSYANPSAPSRSASPKFNIADFENHQLPVSAFTTPTRETSYASQAAIDDLDFARSSQNNTPVSARYGKGIRGSFLQRSASKLLPRGLSTANLPTTPLASGASSPTKSISSFITGNTNTLSSTASKASVRAKTASKVIFDNYFNGSSNDLQIGLPHGRSRNPSVVSTPLASPQREDGYEPDSENMATPTFTRPPLRSRPRKSTITEVPSPSYANKLGSWFGNNKQTLSKGQITVSSRIEMDDPLVSLDMQQALFPYGPVDPLNPTSFNDLLAAAEAVISTYQKAYRQRVDELATLKSEMALKEDEYEESETRTAHLKMQLQDLGEQCTAQTQKADLLEGMLRERPSVAASDCGCASRSDDEDASRRHSRIESGRAASDSGFESDADSVFSAPLEQQQHEDAVRRKDHSHAMLPPASSSSHNQDTQFSMANSSTPLFSTNAQLENEMLRARVVELEAAVDGCLSLISGPAILSGMA